MKTFAPTTPNTTQKPTTPSTVSQDVDEYRVRGYHVAYPPGGGPRAITVAWFEGYDDTGTFVPVVRKKAHLSGANVNSFLDAAVTTSETREDEMLEGLLNLLITEGEIGAGTVS